MDGDITTLLRLTHEMSEALDRDDLDACAALMRERGRRLVDLRTRYGAAAPPAELGSALAEIRELDRGLSGRLAEAMSLIGREMTDLRARKTRRLAGGEAPTYLNRKA